MPVSSGMSFRPGPNALRLDLPCGQTGGLGRLPPVAQRRGMSGRPGGTLDHWNRSAWKPSTSARRDSTRAVDEETVKPPSFFSVILRSNASTSSVDRLAHSKVSRGVSEGVRPTPARASCSEPRRGPARRRADQGRCGIQRSARARPSTWTNRFARLPRGPDRGVACPPRPSCRGDHPRAGCRSGGAGRRTTLWQPAAFRAAATGPRALRRTFANPPGVRRSSNGPRRTPPTGPVRPLRSAAGARPRWRSDWAALKSTSRDRASAQQSRRHERVRRCRRAGPRGSRGSSVVDISGLRAPRRAPHGIHRSRRPRPSARGNR